MRSDELAERACVYVEAGASGSVVTLKGDVRATDLGSIRDWYAGAVDEYWCDTGMLRDEAEAAFDRAIAAHDRALREQIARDIEQHYLGPDFDRNPATGADSPHAAEHQAFDEGLEVAARVAREEGSE